MKNRSELSAHFFRQVAHSLGLGLAVLLFLVACSNETTDASFSYELSQQAFQSDIESPLELQVQENKLEFSIAFKGGGGSYDKADLERSKEMVRIVLLDTDGKAQKMFVLYQLSGSISDLEPDRYTFQVVDIDGRLIAEDSFVIP